MDILDKLSALFEISTDGFYMDLPPTKRIIMDLRANEFNENDLVMISAINRIILSLNFMTEI